MEDFAFAATHFDSAYLVDIAAVFFAIISTPRPTSAWYSMLSSIHNSYLGAVTPKNSPTPSLPYYKVISNLRLSIPLHTEDANEAIYDEPLR